MTTVLTCELCVSEPRLRLPLSYASLVVLHTVIDHGWPVGFFCVWVVTPVARTRITSHYRPASRPPHWIAGTPTPETLLG